MDSIIFYLGLLGSIAFSISGSMTAMKKYFDPFGVLIISFITAVGGGTLRDMLINREIFWISEPIYIYSILIGTILAIIFKNKLNYIHKPLLFFDSIGLALFTVVGVQIGLEYNLAYINCIILATITGAFGGIIRDTLVNEVPIIFKKEIYGTISIFGAIMYLILYNTTANELILNIIPVCFIIICRLIVIKYKISLPSIN